MNDDVSTTESDQPMSDNSAAEEPEEPMAGGESEPAAEKGENGGGPGKLGSFKNLLTGGMLVRVGGAIMAIAALFSWLEVGNDSFPNVAGVGTTTFGVGLTVFVLGLSLFLRPWSVAVTLGTTLGAIGITLVFISIVGTSGGELAIGAWIGLAGSGIALIGALQVAAKSDKKPTLDVRLMPVALGAALAVVASFWLDWMLNFGLYIFSGSESSEPLNGLHPDVLFGVPILILGGIVLLACTELTAIPLITSEGRRQVLLLVCQIAGIAITVIAGSNVVGMMLLGLFVFGSGPLVALVGGLLMIRSIREA